jgi:hypothetical protein
MKGKGGQFFILAAVILSGILISLSSVRNYVSSVEKQEAFYDLSKEIKEESFEVLDYGIYNNKDMPRLIENFTSEIAKYSLDKEPDLEFIFIYGNESSLAVENYGKNESYLKIGDEIEKVSGGGEMIRSNIALNFENENFNLGVFNSKKNYNSNWNKKVSPIKKNIAVAFGGSNYNFSLGKNQQFFMIVKKILNNEEYIEVK